MVDLTQEITPLRIWTYKGNTRQIPFVFGMVLTGYTFSASIQLSTDQSITTLPVLLTDLANGKVALNISSAVDTAVPLGAHKWWLKWTDPAGFVRTLFSGPYMVTDAP
jgi:hypothetical protein